MARPLRIEFEGAVYHILSRGNARQNIFLSNNDKEKFLEILSSVVKRFGWLCHAYCLMDNHYHLAVETPEANLSRGMRQVNGVYTQYFNRTHERVGHLFQGRFKAILVDKDSYLLSLCRYVVLNPVRAGFVKRPEQWKWSSHRATVGKVARKKFLTVNWVLFQFGSDMPSAAIQYEKFVREGVEKDSLWEEVRGQMFLGTDAFVKKFKALIKEKEKITEIPRLQRYIARPPLETILKEVHTKEKKDKAIHEAYVTYGYTMKEIAEHLGVHYTTISKMIKRIEATSEN